MKLVEVKLVTSYIVTCYNVICYIIFKNDKNQILSMVKRKSFGKLFTYDAMYKSGKKRVDFHRKLYGSLYYSKNGPIRKGGLLSEIPFINPTRSCIIVKPEHSAKLRNFFRQHKVKWSEHLVVLKEKESREFM